MIIDRENEINAFTPEEYWSIVGQFNKDGKNFEASFYGDSKKKIKLENKEQVDEILSRMTDDKFEITNIVKKERKRNPAPPFTTSSLQQEAARKLNFRARKTMMIAQQLYEGINTGKQGVVGLITYMRTDSTRISDTAKNEAFSFIETMYGDDFIGKTKQKAKESANTQDAHEAVRPTSVTRPPDAMKQFLTRDQHRLYKLIWERFVASQMASAVLDTVSADLMNADVKFRASGSEVKFAGFMKVYIEGEDDQEEKKDGILPPLEKGEHIKGSEIDPKQHFTQPPPRYSEARLVKTMEELGIGRPSTYAPTLDTIQKRGYVTLDAKRFVPTELGGIVHQAVNQYFPDIIDIEFTAEMEKSLDHVEDGSIQWKQVIDEFYRDFEKHLKVADEEMEKIEIKDEPAGEDCEKCGNPMVYKMGRYGKFMACSNFPDCRNTKAIIKPIGVTCPTCKEGQVVERKSKTKRIFFGCDRYPECEYVSWDKPITRPCPKCQNTLVEKRLKKGVQIQCTECDYKEVTQE